MNIDSIKNGIVIDHITAGKGMLLYELLHLGELDCSVALIKNAPSRKICKKDIIKVDSDIAIDYDVVGYAAPEATVNIIKDSVLVEKCTVPIPQTLTNVIHCKNPRCITSVERDLDNIFELKDAESKVYRCLYCDAEAN